MRQRNSFIVFGSCLVLAACSADTKLADFVPPAFRPAQAVVTAPVSQPAPPDKSIAANPMVIQAIRDVVTTQLSQSAIDNRDNHVQVQRILVAVTQPTVQEPERTKIKDAAVTIDSNTDNIERANATIKEQGTKLNDARDAAIKAQNTVNDWIKVATDWAKKYIADMGSEKAAHESDVKQLTAINVVATTQLAADQVVIKKQAEDIKSLKDGHAFWFDVFLYSVAAILFLATLFFGFMAAEGDLADVSLALLSFAGCIATLAFAKYQDPVEFYGGIAILTIVVIGGTIQLVRKYRNTHTALTEVTQIAEHAKANMDPVERLATFGQGTNPGKIQGFATDVTQKIVAKIRNKPGFEKAPPITPPAPVTTPVNPA